ncbi:MAG: nitrous oxide reductase family maturation protein NosD [Sulfurimonas sp.]|uniref:nitrous oxide reductase family maturation protein NosD n=1 Tax=Sulfurimonas sp. TaxID=2022749 RepID=UPI0025F7D5E2|nr:nitrous oxide reductase family maturation protein NosD [Sulfurimonas sp.]MCK9490984.1 nitrous oxide reductase family maturation protein NosD [Sulfurimonas sp.]
MRKFLLFLLFIYTLNASSLQEAIDKAPVGATLKLYSGVYSGNIIITKPLTIVGVEDGVIIDGGNVGSVITIKSSNVSLSKLIIQNSGSLMYSLDSGIKIEKAKNINISNCKILDSLYGIDMYMVQNSTIKENFISSKDFDIALRGDALKIWHSNNNLITKNTITKTRDINLNYSHDNIILNNNITNSRFALKIAHSKNTLIEKNIFKYNSVSIIMMMNENSKIISNSILSSNGAAGIGVILQQGSTIFDSNKLRYNAKAIYIDSNPNEQSIKRYITNNDISYNKEAIGFHMTIRQNKITNNVFEGNIDDIVKNTAGYKTMLNVVEYNYWDRYAGFDTDGDNIGDNSFLIYQYADRLWHYNNKVKFFYGAPIMSMLNFLAQVAPFIEPIMLLEDTKPLVERLK